MKFDKSIKIAICLAVLALFPLGLWAFLLSSRIAHGGVLWIFPDSLTPALRVACVVLPVLALAYALLILVRAFCLGATKPVHLVLICVSWILGTFALHCWVLDTLAHMPPWTSVKDGSEDGYVILNSMLTGYAGTAEDRARARAEMQKQFPGGSRVTVPSVEQKLAIALKFEENQRGYLQSMAATADNAERLIARRAWISWVAIAFVPIIVLVGLRTRRLSEDPSQPSSSHHPERL
jgi:hypothetical protein